MLEKYKVVHVRSFINELDAWFAHVQYWNTVVEIRGDDDEVLGVMLRNDIAWDLMQTRETMFKHPEYERHVKENFIFLDRWTMTFEEFHERGMQMLEWLNEEPHPEPPGRRRSIIILPTDEDLHDEGSPRCEIFREVDAMELIKCLGFTCILEEEQLPVVGRA